MVRDCCKASIDKGRPALQIVSENSISMIHDQQRKRNMSQLFAFPSHFVTKNIMSNFFDSTQLVHNSKPLSTYCHKIEIGQ